MKLVQKYRGSWGVTIPLAAIAIVFMVFFFVPGQRSIGRLREELQTKTTYVNQAQSLAGTITQAALRTDEAVRYNAAERPMALSQHGLEDFFGRLNDLASENTVRIDRLDPQETVPMQTLTRTTVQWEVAGKLDPLLAMLARIDALDQAVWVESLELSSPRELGQPMHCKITFVVFGDRSSKSD